MYTAKIRDIAQKVVARATLSEDAEATQAALIEIVQESIDLLKNRYKASFVKSMHMDANLIGATGDPDDGFGIHFGAGLNAFVTEHIALNAEVRYNFAETDFSFTSGGYSVDTQFDMNSWMVALGLKFVF